MKTKVILFAREDHEKSKIPPRILFASWGSTLDLELPNQMGVEDFSNKIGFKRHSQFDYLVGDMGRKVTLLEWVHGTPESSLVIDTQRTLQLRWNTFRQTAEALTGGADRRFLQLAVQYLAAGERIDDSVIAADYDAEFIQSLQQALVKQDPKSEL